MAAKIQYNRGEKRKKTMMYKISVYKFIQISAYVCTFNRSYNQENRQKMFTSCKNYIHHKEYFNKINLMY
ncbi:hypothetical protein QE441_002698 [Chryseobacterium sp. SORGH_AS909]|uniref:Uncharacterized protein n=1 Tax=Chryseobacterium camelliae TaxID=1265445 RepID=A0ABU0TEX9_9FLAO|nr:hypothetical protein [Chryseobacterium camelliae]MDQ1099557.1 hypothetical protein [Chryseobacterium sp. SORGH_AS_1048]MDR6086904.1 hypothetical protein [Chryseobacterium sp. SORGH_AS_0909]MDR6131278.1 hypothetical protein [Chryseobacterium sp. SORGH_AS_1175]MDT3406583.1 hypothetical protein [Pseudacidovorax intermedius]